MNFPQKIHKKMPVLRSLDEGGNFVTKNSVNRLESVSKRQKTLYVCRASFTNPTFFEKTNPILCVFSPKTAILLKNEPKTNPNEPKRTQFLPRYI